MNILDFTIKESLRRLRKSFTGVLFVLLGISIFVASQTINKALYDQAKEQLLRFGANIIVQPKGEPFDIYSGTVKGGLLLPESYANEIQTISHSNMLIAVSPKLFERFEIKGKSILVAGITPDERQAKRWWMVDKSVITDREFPKEQEVLLGNYTAFHLGDNVSQLTLGNESFRIIGVLDETGSPDDFMAFVPLTTLQKLIERKGMVNLIEVSTSCIACKAMDIYDVAKEIDDILPPDAKVLLVKQIAEAQMGTLKKIIRFTKIVYLVLLGLCTILLINYMSSAVDERRREIGMLLAMGMDPLKIQIIFTLKTLFIAGIGGLLGYFIGTGVSIIVGPLLAETKIHPIPLLLLISLAISFVLGLITSIVTAMRISKLDPVDALKEV